MTDKVKSKLELAVEMGQSLPLKEFLEEVTKESPMRLLPLLDKMVDLESIEMYLNAVFGIKLEINVLPAEREEGHFYGKGLIDTALNQKAYDRV